MEIFLSEYFLFLMNPYNTRNTFWYNFLKITLENDKEASIIVSYHSRSFNYKILITQFQNTYEITKIKFV